MNAQQIKSSPANFESQLMTLCRSALYQEDKYHFDPLAHAIKSRNPRPDDVESLIEMFRWFERRNGFYSSDVDGSTMASKACKASLALESWAKSLGYQVNVPTFGVGEIPIVNVGNVVKWFSENYQSGHPNFEAVSDLVTARFVGMEGDRGASDLVLQKAFVASNHGDLTALDVILWICETPRKLAE